MNVLSSGLLFFLYWYAAHRDLHSFPTRRSSDLAAGIVARRASGRQVYFKANPKSPIFADLRNIVTKTFGVADLLRSALDGLADRIRVAFVYGSEIGRAHV